MNTQSDTRLHGQQVNVTPDLEARARLRVTIERMAATLKDSTPTERPIPAPFVGTLLRDIGENGNVIIMHNVDGSLFEATPREYSFADPASVRRALAPQPLSKRAQGLADREKLDALLAESNR